MSLHGHCLIQAQVNVSLQFPHLTVVAFASSLSVYLIELFRIEASPSHCLVYVTIDLGFALMLCLVL